LVESFSAGKLVSRSLCGRMGMEARTGGGEEQKGRRGREERKTGESQRGKGGE